MKRIILFLLLFSSLIYAQPRTGLATSAQLDTVIVKQELVLDTLNISNNLLRTNQSDLIDTLNISNNLQRTNSSLLIDSLTISNNLQRTNSSLLIDSLTISNNLLRDVIVNSTGGYGAKSVLITATQLSASSVECKKIIITNNTAGSTLYIGFNASITTSNGSDVLGYLDSSVITLNNLNKVYLIGSTTIDCRYRYEN